MKVSLIMATRNKPDLLVNTLYSISQQKISFPFEVCIVDDCSDIDPEPIIRKFIPDVKYKRFQEQIHFIYSKGEALKLINKNSDVILLQSDDVVHTQENSIELICRGVKEGTVSLADVVNIEITEDLSINFEDKINPILNSWDNYIKVERLLIDNTTYKVPTKYSGLGVKSNLFFCGAIHRNDLEKLDFKQNNCDAVLKQKLKSINLKVVYPQVKCIHQKHPKFVYYCPIVKSCKYNCIRKLGTHK